MTTVRQCENSAFYDTKSRLQSSDALHGLNGMELIFKCSATEIVEYLPGATEY